MGIYLSEDAIEKIWQKSAELIAEVDSMRTSMHFAIALSLPAPQGDRAFDGVDDATELGQEIVAHQLEDPAVVLA
jgi:hypothetical protein